MRNKINVIHGKSDITDVELERFRNFDALLNNHYRILNEKKPITWKIIVPAVILAGSVVLYWMLNDNDTKAVEDRSLTPDSVVLPDKKENVKVQPESIEPEKERNEPQETEKSNSVKVDIRISQPSAEEKTDSAISIDKEPVKAFVAQADSTPDSPPKIETVYVRAEPINGYETLYAYFSKELIYPEAAVKDSIEGVLIVKFLINKEGKPEKIETSGTLGVLFDKEAVRLIEHMPLWKPATVNGKPIASKLSLPLTFQLRSKK